MVFFQGKKVGDMGVGFVLFLVMMQGKKGVAYIARRGETRFGCHVKVRLLR